MPGDEAICISEIFKYKTVPLEGILYWEGVERYFILGGGLEGILYWEGVRRYFILGGDWKVFYIERGVAEARNVKFLRNVCKFSPIEINILSFGKLLRDFLKLPPQFLMALYKLIILINFSTR